MRLFFDWVIVVYCFGTVTAYYVVIGQYLQAFFIGLNVGDDSLLAQRWFVMAALATPLIAFMSLKRDLTALRYFSLFSVIVMLFVCFAVVFRGITSSEVLTGKNPYNLDDFTVELIGFDWSTFPKSATLVIFAFTCHVNIFPVFSELYNPSYRRMSKALSRAIAACVSVYSLVSIFGYLTFLQSTEGNIINNYDHSDPLFIFVRGCVGVTLSLNTPLTVNPAMRILEMLLFNIDFGEKDEQDANISRNSIGSNGGMRHSSRSNTAKSYNSFPKIGNVDADDNHSIPMDLDHKNTSDGTVHTPHRKKINRKKHGYLPPSNGVQSSPLPAHFFDPSESEMEDEDDENLNCISRCCVRTGRRAYKSLLNAHFLRWSVMTITFVCGALCLAIAVPTVDTVFSILGASCATTIAYILPVYLFFQVDESPIFSGKKISLLIMLFVIVVLSTLSIIDTIESFL